MSTVKDPLRVWRLALTLVLGASGGALFYVLSLPLPWMLGSMCFVAAMAVVGGPVTSVRKIRPPMATVIGVTLGSAFAPEILNQFYSWIPLTLAAISSTVLIGLVGTIYLQKVAGFDTVTAFFSAMPAGVYEMTSQGGLMGGDERRIALIHALRVFLVVLTVPIVFRIIFDIGSTGQTDKVGLSEYSLQDAITLILCALLGWWGALKLHLPNAPMLGPLMASAAVHAAGITSIAPPYMLVAFAQVFLGASVGGQFIGAKLRELGRTAMHGFVLIPIMLAVCLLVASVTASTSSMDFQTIFLALSPGGTAEMSLIALTMQLEVAAVVSHQFLRVVLIHSLAPVVFHIVDKK